MARCQRPVFTWEEAESQVADGGLGRPNLLFEEGRLITDPTRPVNPAFRFPDVKPCEIRSAGNLMNGDANRSRSIETPIQLPHWGHVVSMLKSIQLTASSRPFAKADREAEY